MLVRILEIERLDARGVFVPIRQSLRPGRSVLDAIFTQHLIRPVHVADDDGDVLKPKIVAARIGRDRAAARSKKLNEFDRLIAQPHSDDADAGTEHPEQMLDVFTRDFRVRSLFKREHVRVKINRAVHISNGHLNRPDCDDLGLCRRAAFRLSLCLRWKIPACKQKDREQDKLPSGLKRMSRSSQNCGRLGAARTRRNAQAFLQVIANPQGIRHDR